MLCVAEEDQEYMLTSCRYMVSGVIIASPKIEPETIEKIIKMDIPVVMLESRNLQTISDNIITISIDYEPGISQILKKVELDGRKTIGCVVANKFNVNKGLRIKTSKLNTLIDLVEKSSLTLDQDFIINLLNNEENMDNAYLRCLEHIKDIKNIPNVIFCSNDSVAVGVIRAVRESGFSIPEDVAIVGIDNTMIGDATYPPLSSISS